MEDLLINVQTAVGNAQGNLHTLRTSAFENNPYILAIVISLLIFSLYLVLSRLMGPEFRLAVGGFVPLALIPLAQLASSDRIWLDTLYSIVIEIIGGLVVFSLFPMLNNLNYDFRLICSQNNVRSITYCTFLICLYVVATFVFILFCLNTAEYLRVALILFVEVLAGMLINFILLAIIIGLIGINTLFILLFKPRLFSEMVELYPLRFVISIFILMMTFVLIATVIVLFTQLPEAVLNPSFPQNLAFACVGAIGSMLVADFIQRADRHESIGWFVIVRIILLICAVGFLYLGVLDTNIVLSIMTEVVGIILVTTLMSNHIFTKSRA